jgi:Asp-tRNA(Asn)/Glu-tRNA(Gln) amidotransferase A subunit family amidase
LGILSCHDRFDIEGYVTGFGNPDWQQTHEPAAQTAPVVTFVVQGGATCVGRTVMDEMAYRLVVVPQNVQIFF